MRNKNGLPYDRNTSCVLTLHQTIEAYLPNSLNKVLMYMDDENEILGLPKIPNSLKILILELWVMGPLNLWEAF